MGISWLVRFSISLVIRSGNLSAWKIEFLPIMLERRLINRGKPVPEFLQSINRSRTKATESLPPTGLRSGSLAIPLIPPKPGNAARRFYLAPRRKTISDIADEYEIRQYSNYHSSKLITRSVSPNSKFSDQTRLHDVCLFESR